MASDDSRWNNICDVFWYSLVRFSSHQWNVVPLLRLYYIVPTSVGRLLPSAGRLAGPVGLAGCLEDNGLGLVQNWFWTWFGKKGLSLVSKPIWTWAVKTYAMFVISSIIFIIWKKILGKAWVRIFEKIFPPTGWIPRLFPTSANDANVSTSNRASLANAHSVLAISCTLNSAGFTCTSRAGGIIWFASAWLENGRAKFLKVIKFSKSFQIPNSEIPKFPNPKISPNPPPT